MKYNDLVYGSIEIDDKTAVAIIKHPAMQRVKKIYISAYGYLFNLQRSSTRFEHCIGVYLILKKFGASYQEQIAGLIHDISHTAFSHVSTYALLGKFTGTEFHELKHKEIIENSGLANHLAKFKLDHNQLLHAESFKLLDNDLPDICADRLDYTLRDGLHLQVLSRQQAETILNGLEVLNNEFVFNNVEAAFIYSHTFYILNLMFYGSASEAHFNNDFGALIKYAVKKGVLKDKEWFTDDEYITNKLRKSKNTKIIKWLAKYSPKLVTLEDSKNPDVVFPKKIRIVDPKVKQGSKLKRLSELSEPYNYLMSEYKKTHQKHELPVKLIIKN